MPLEFALRLITFIAFGIAIILAFVYFLVYKRNVKIVEATSNKLNCLKNLNKNIKFYEVNENLYFEETSLSKKNFQKQSTKSCLQNLILSDIEKYSELIDKVEENKKKNYGYWLEVVALEKQKTHLPDNINLKSEKYIEIENYLFKKLVLKPVLEFNVEVLIEYKSPKGRKHYNKHEIFSYSNFKQIYNQSIKGLIEKETKFYHSKIERAKLTPALRYKILCKDNFKCQICGKSAQEGITLHIDHIIPVSKGGKTEMNNLRTLCSDCNLGKGKEYDNAKTIDINNDIVEHLHSLLKNENN